MLEIMWGNGHLFSPNGTFLPKKRRSADSRTGAGKIQDYSGRKFKEK